MIDHQARLPLILALILLLLPLAVVGCTRETGLYIAGDQPISTATTAMKSTSAMTTGPAATAILPAVPTPTAVPTLSPAPSPASTAKATTRATATGGPTVPIPTGSGLAGTVVVLDPGHQQKANYEKEPVAPWSTELKTKCSAGTSGVATRRAEYVVDLEIALRMRDYLEAQGCTVYLTRTTHNVDISNIDRANIALSYEPDAYIRIHCNGSTDSTQTGTSVFVANTGKYASQLVDWGNLMTDCICAQTGGRARKTTANAVYTGLNWATDIPAFLLELGYMTNPDEDRLLSDPGYQQKICQGIVDFVAAMPRR